jgi:hypothetical protein
MVFENLTQQEHNNQVQLRIISDFSTFLYNNILLCMAQSNLKEKELYFQHSKNLLRMVCSLMACFFMFESYINQLDNSLDTLSP